MPIKDFKEITGKDFKDDEKVKNMLLQMHEVQARAGGLQLRFSAVETVGKFLRSNTSLGKAYAEMSTARGSLEGVRAQLKKFKEENRETSSEAKELDVQRKKIERQFSEAHEKIESEVEDKEHLINLLEVQYNLSKGYPTQIAGFTGLPQNSRLYKDIRDYYDDPKSYVDKSGKPEDELLNEMAAEYNKYMKSFLELEEKFESRAKKLGSDEVALKLFADIRQNYNPTNDQRIALNKAMVAQERGRLMQNYAEFQATNPAHIFDLLVKLNALDLAAESKKLQDSVNTASKEAKEKNVSASSKKALPQPGYKLKELKASMAPQIQLIESSKSLANAFPGMANLSPAAAEKWKKADESLARMRRPSVVMARQPSQAALSLLRRQSSSVGTTASLIKSGMAGEKATVANIDDDVTPVAPPQARVPAAVQNKSTIAPTPTAEPDAQPVPPKTTITVRH